ncbi:HdeD family acid-resistance protein [Legionella sp. W05-934-2]|jgi:uncharacterized membrane protein HdeD (DUF308 family)|uniref:HdeD family acid-resistance protein n=1 Tax=Legionella sp. W05-934-2 TaxID=1198649 RepID=UPI003461E64D
MKEQDKEIFLASRRLQRNWGWLLFLGILFVILGTVGLGMLVSITVMSMYFIAVLLFIAGFAQLADSFKCLHWHGMLWHLVIAFLYLIAGALVSYDPLMASTLITAFLAWLFIFMGIARTILWFKLNKAPGTGWFLLSALASLALGVILLVHWPMSGVWFIGLIIAIELIVAGWTYILLAVSFRRHMK